MDFWKMVKTDNGIGQIHIEGEIAPESWWGDEYTPARFRKELEDLGKISEIELLINSIGGDVFAANAIATTLKLKKLPTKAIVTGLAASAATIIMLSADKVVMPKTSFAMFHRMSSIARGNADDFRTQANVLESIEKPYIDVIINKMAKKGVFATYESILEMLNAETWLSGEQAFNLGLADEVMDMEIAAKLDGDEWDINGTKYANKFQSKPGNEGYETFKAKVEAEKQKQIKAKADFDKERQRNINLLKHKILT